MNVNPGVAAKNLSYNMVFFIAIILDRVSHKRKLSALGFTHSHYIYRQKRMKYHKLSIKPIRCQYFKQTMNENEKKVNVANKRWPAQNDYSKPSPLCHMYLKVSEIHKVSTSEFSTPISLGNKPASEPVIE